MGQTVTRMLSQAVKIDYIMNFVPILLKLRKKVYYNQLLINYIFFP